MFGRAVAYSYGLFTLGLAHFGAATTASYWRKDSKEKVEDLKSASNELWSLSESVFSHTHGFVTLDNGLQLHYLRSPQQASPSEVRTLIVFLHGFPDSSHIFTKILQSRASREAGALCIALDLPGYGGSEGLAGYGASEVLNTIAEGITKLKERYFPSLPSPDSEQRQCILVGHDWGGCIVYRIAAETTGLVDNVIVVNSTHPPHARENIQNRIKAAQQAFTQWRTAPQRLSLLRTAYHHVAPIPMQLVLSGYIFMFNLPFPLAKWFPGLVSHLVKWTVINGHHREDDTAQPGQFASNLSSCFGPSVDECSTRLSDGTTYGRSVLERSLTKPPGDWDERIRLYREGLATRSWKANEVTSKFLVKSDDSDFSLPKQQRTFERRSFQCPITIIYGLQDLALDPRIMLDGIEQYIAPNRAGRAGGQSHVVRLKDCGHWSPIERTGVEVLEATLHWRARCVGGEARSSSEQSDQGLESFLEEAVYRGDVKVLTV